MRRISWLPRTFPIETLGAPGVVQSLRHCYAGVHRRGHPRKLGIRAAAPGGPAAGAVARRTGGQLATDYREVNRSGSGWIAWVNTWFGSLIRHCWGATLSREQLLTSGRLDMFVLGLKVRFATARCLGVTPRTCQSIASMNQRCR